MRGIFGIATLILSGIIVATLVTNPAGVQAGGTALNNVLATSYAAMLGYNPLSSQKVSR
jgi:hypothetical protein